MEKNIKDYLHLYGFCELWDIMLEKVVSLYFISSETKMPLKIKRGKNVFGREYSDVKLCLRNLSDMTEEEQIRVYLWEYPNYKSGEIVKNDSDNDFFVVKNENGMKCYINQHHFSAETTRKLLAAGFDLFCLIESGLAIDKSKL